MHPSPSVSAVITCFEEADVIVDTIRSALTQSSPHLREVIVVDDGSTDGSAGIIAASFAGESRLRVVRRENGGLSAARNTGIAQASGDWIALLDGDDLWESDRISAAISAISANPSVGLVYSDFHLFTSTSSRRVHVNDFRGRGPATVADLLTRGGPIVPSSVTVDKALVDRLGGFDESLRSAEDTDMWIRVLAVAESVRIPAPLVRKRDHPTSLGKRRTLKVESMEQVVRKAVAAHPEVARAGRTRLARSFSVQARRAAEAGAPGEALVAAGRSLRRDPTARVAWAALARALTLGPWRAVRRSQRGHGGSRPTTAASSAASSR